MKLREARLCKGINSLISMLKLPNKKVPLYIYTDTISNYKIRCHFLFSGMKKLYILSIDPQDS